MQEVSGPKMSEEPVDKKGRQARGEETTQSQSPARERDDAKSISSDIASWTAKVTASNAK